MKIILANGTELNPIMVVGASSFIQGAKRDKLSFVFSADEDMSALDKAFTESACESIKLISGESENVYKAYVIRAELKKQRVEKKPATPESEAVTEDRITVAMAQRTYMESQLSALNVLLTGEE